MEAAATDTGDQLLTGYVLGPYSIHRHAAAAMDGRSGHVIVLPTARGHRAGLPPTFIDKRPAEIYPWEFASALQEIHPDFDHKDRNSPFRKLRRSCDVSAFVVAPSGIYLTVEPLKTVDPAQWNGREQRRRPIVEVGFISAGRIYPVNLTLVQRSRIGGTELAARLRKLHPSIAVSPAAGQTLLNVYAQLSSSDFSGRNLGEISGLLAGAAAEGGMLRSGLFPSSDVISVLGRTIGLPRHPTHSDYNDRIPQQRSSEPVVPPELPTATPARHQPRHRSPRVLPAGRSPENLRKHRRS